MRDSRIHPVIGLGAHAAENGDPPLHRRWRRDAIARTDDGEGGRLDGADVRVGRIGHDDGRRPGHVGSAEAGRSVAADERRHARAGRAAPERVSAGFDLELGRVAKHEADRSRKVAGGDLAAQSDLVFQDEGVEPGPADLGGIGKAFMDGADIGETASRGDDRERRTGLATQEEQPRMRLAGSARRALSS